MTKEHYNYVKVSQLLICFSIIVYFGDAGAGISESLGQLFR